ncbi:glycosyltransferase family 2 protein [Wohlfahrtiimonas chitiniclastica]|uniref:glycosyltransferase family 2 protein n=1 Tax=Wohlfahrtiimonas chitiniclastica TaxID=400946 RepID=UPI001BCE6053|nr:glycosyltransferase family 2 protein [Wohlfahrtiimonas chitiniclastica]MBS7834588.1 glycosyltransferase family 2 protein [Wohlfahrtiimonas chitiniclastica]
MKISVIVPVYKVEKYIGKCIQSLLDQTYSNFEALIVDDGSPDQSITIAKELVGNDPRFIFLEKENGGLSSARNYGLDHATGDYIYFLDSDDYIASDTLQLSLDTLIQSNADVVVFGWKAITPEGEILIKFMPDIDAYNEKNDLLLTQRTIDVAVWNKIFRRDIFCKIRFKEGIISEDIDLTYRLIFGRKIILLEKYLYFYVQSPNSISRSHDSIKYQHSFLTISEGMLFFLKQKGLTESHYIEWQRFYLSLLFFGQINRCIRYSENYPNIVKELNNTLDCSLLNLRTIVKLFGVFSKENVAYTLLKVSPKLYGKFYSFLYIKRKR